MCVSLMGREVFVCHWLETFLQLRYPFFIQPSHLVLPQTLQQIVKYCLFLGLIANRYAISIYIGKTSSVVIWKFSAHSPAIAERKAWWRDYNSYGGVDVVSNTYSAQLVIFHYIWSLLKLNAMNVEFCATYHHGGFHPPSFMAHLLNIIIISDTDS